MRVFSALGGWMAWLFGSGKFESKCRPTERGDGGEESVEIGIANVWRKRQRMIASNER